MSKISLNVRVFLVLLAGGIACSVLLAGVAYFRLQQKAMTAAGAEAKLLMDRAVQTFLVSTIKFDREVTQAKSEEEKKAVHQRWFATILAVDDAVTHDFGAGVSRIRLIGDKDITGAAPLGGDNTKIGSSFEREALTALKNDASKPVQRIEEGFLRIAAGLPAGAHPGCATCHNMSNNTVYPPQLVLGSLNAYVPLDKHLAEARASAWLLGFGVLGVFVVFALGVSFWIVRSITRPLGGEPSSVVSALTAMAGGDLAAPINVAAGDRDSVMASLKLLQERWRDILGNMRGSVARLNDSAQNLQGTAASVADASRQQNAATSETAAATEQMTGGIGQITDGTAAAKDMAVESAQLAEDGQKLVAVAVGEIDAIAAHVREFENRIVSLGQQSQQISSITSVIKEIADQTNLLALNAAIEAARAGETGRGFAVVADEVRKLAERTTASTTEIRGMIESIQQETETTSQMMGESRKRIDQGVAAINQLVDPLGRLHEGGQEAARRMTELSDATREQSVAASTVAQHIESIAQASDRNAYAVQSVAEAVDGLRVVAQELEVAIKHFRY